jgi:hypothetical protein
MHSEPRRTVPESRPRKQATWIAHNVLGREKSSIFKMACARRPLIWAGPKENRHGITSVLRGHSGMSLKSALRLPLCSYRSDRPPELKQQPPVEIRH